MFFEQSPSTTNILDISVSKERYLSNEFALQRLIFESQLPSVRPASFKEKVGWIVEGNSIINDKNINHSYNYSFSSNQVIKNPREYFSFQLGMGVMVGLSATHKNTHWNCCELAFLGLSNNIGYLASHTKFGIITNISYRSLLFSKPSEFKFQISNYGDIELLIDEELIMAIATEWLGIPYYLYGVGNQYNNGTRYDIPLRLINCKAGIYN